jgi:hypothetical protein
MREWLVAVIAAACVAAFVIFGTFMIVWAYP